MNTNGSVDEPRLPLIHLDDGLAVVHKPAGIHTHPSALSPREDSAARWLGQQLGRRVLIEATGRACADGPLQTFVLPEGTPPAGCPLCGHAAQPLHEERRRYYYCTSCGLVHRERAQWPDAVAERARLERHRNRPGDAGYRDWLRPLARALADRLPAGAAVLDLGCGPEPVLAGLLREAGLRAESWDPLFHPVPEPTGPLGGITLCEVFEHLREPQATLDQLDSLLAPGGWLALSTGMLERPEALPGWWYARDPVHLIFATPATLDWIAGRMGWTLEREGRLVLFHKPEER